jgi:sulfate permease, SulP family
MGLFKLGSLIRFIPVAVIIGFTNAIAVLIILSQIKDFLGLEIVRMPADFWGLTQSLWLAKNTLNPYALAVSGSGLLFLIIWQGVLPNWLQNQLKRNSQLGLASKTRQAYLFLSKLNKVPGPILVLVFCTTWVWLAQWPYQALVLALAAYLVN